VTGPTPTPERDRAVKIATIALHRALAGDLPGAASYVERLNGTGGLITAIIGWCDTYICRIAGADAYGKGIRIAWWNVETGSIETDADKMPPPQRWAGRVIAARAADDEPGFYALLRAPAEGSELGDCITALLDMVARSLNSLPDMREASA
jgi:hypothetical protein